jgi:hypothetical protein
MHYLKLWASILGIENLDRFTLIGYVVTKRPGCGDEDVRKTHPIKTIGTDGLGN